MVVYSVYYKVLPSVHLQICIGGLVVGFIAIRDAVAAELADTINMMGTFYRDTVLQSSFGGPFAGGWQVNGQPYTPGETGYAPAEPESPGDNDPALVGVWFAVVPATDETP